MKQKNKTSKRSFHFLLGVLVSMLCFTNTGTCQADKQNKLDPTHPDKEKLALTQMPRMFEIDYARIYVKKSK